MPDQYDQYPATLILDPGDEYHSATRQWQGIPGIERASNGRLWATWYTGSDGEGIGNHAVLVTSDDDGETWTEPVLVIAPPTDARVFDPCLWIDPLGRMWLFWAQCHGGHFDGVAGVWAVRTAQPDDARPTWTEPRRLAHGIMMNKPTVTSDGRWLIAHSVWAHKQPIVEAMAPYRFAGVSASDDQGETFHWLGGADVPEYNCDEHMVVERDNGELWMLVRRKYGIGESVSHDGGHTWSPGSPAGINGPATRFFIRRLRSGRLLLVYHDPPPDERNSRSHLTAWLSDDDGQSWRGKLLLDDRATISYPDGIEAPDGSIYIIYDHNRGGRKSNKQDREILLAVIREADILAGQVCSKNARLRCVVNRADVDDAVGSTTS